MLSTLMKLKQICNHPAQFLQDGSPFTPERSHKLERLGQMLEEVMAEGDSVLIFSQFTEVGSQPEALFKRGLGHNTYYLRGGTVTAAVQGNVNHSRGVFQLAGFKVQVGLSIRL